MNGTARRLPIYGTSDKLTNSLFFQDQAATSGTSVLGTLVTLDNGNGFGSLSVAENITAQTGNLTVSQGNGYIGGFLGVGVQGDVNYKLNVLGTAKASQSVFIGSTTSSLKNFFKYSYPISSCLPSNFFSTNSLGSSKRK